jgi:hypothetical protein
MPNLHLQVKLNGAPAIGASAKVETVADVSRFLRKAEASVRSAMKVFPELRGHKVLAISVRPD